ncbi:unnamed protein product [Acanthosepion pharaonis]|uniref:Uncharacterized protein n=1 Tax=Acanthosepion pharaonis TaxID=158019 RepID=A0A812DJ71_ACAPH|nr:unnamed protein product [Sepia pharaonis]
MYKLSPHFSMADKTCNILSLVLTSPSHQSVRVYVCHHPLSVGTCLLLVCCPTTSLFVTTLCLLAPVFCWYVALPPLCLSPPFVCWHLSSVGMLPYHLFVCHHPLSVGTRLLLVYCPTTSLFVTTLCLLAPVFCWYVALPPLCLSPPFVLCLNLSFILKPFTVCSYLSSLIFIYLSWFLSLSLSLSLLLLSVCLSLSLLTVCACLCLSLIAVSLSLIAVSLSLSDCCLSDCCLSDCCLSDCCLSDCCLSDCCLSLIAVSLLSL